MVVGVVDGDGSIDGVVDGDGFIVGFDCYAILFILILFLFLVLLLVCEGVSQYGARLSYS